MLVVDLYAVHHAASSFQSDIPVSFTIQKDLRLNVAICHTLKAVVGTAWDVHAWP